MSLKTKQSYDKVDWITLMSLRSWVSTETINKETTFKRSLYCVSYEEIFEGQKYQVARYVRKAIQLKIIAFSSVRTLKRRELQFTWVDAIKCVSADATLLANNQSITICQ